METVNLAELESSKDVVLEPHVSECQANVGIEIFKLSVTADQISNSIKRANILTSIHDDIIAVPTWLRICKFVTSSGCCGRCVVQFKWNYSREGSCMFFFNAGWGKMAINTQFKDHRVNKLRIVRNYTEPVSDAYIDVFIDNVIDREILTVNTELYSDSVAYSGNIEAIIPEGYVIDEYDIT